MADLQMKIANTVEIIAPNKHAPQAQLVFVSSKPNFEIN